MENTAKLCLVQFGNTNGTATPTIPRLTVLFAKPESAGRPHDHTSLIRIQIHLFLQDL